MLPLLLCGLTGLYAPSALAAPAPPAHDPLPVSVSIHPLTLLVQAVGGDDVAVSTLLPPGASPHGFEPAPTQVRHLAGTRLLVTVGGGLDPWAERLGRGLSGSASRLVLMDGPSEPGSQAHDDHDGSVHEGPDPHVWLDPLLVRDRLVPAIATALAAVDPAHADGYTRRAGAFQERLSALDAELTRTLAPVRGLAFVAFHGPWGRFAERYALRQVAVVEPSPGRDPSARWMVRVVDAARQAEARLMLIEPQFNPRVARTIAEQFGGVVVTADPLGGPERGDTYEDLLRRAARAFQQPVTP